MRITSPLYDAYLKCPTKCFLRAGGEIATENEYLEWARTEKALFVREGSQRLMQETEGGECVCGDHAAGSAKPPKWRLAINFPASAENLESTIHAVEHVPSQGRGKSARFLPIRFIYTDKLGRDDRLLLAFDVLVLSKMLGREVSLGKIIHGQSHAMLNVKTSALAVQVRKHIADIAELLSNPSPPDLILIRHCTECEFQAQCRQKAMEKEDLSLLSGMTAKERKKLHDKGIFTVTQLSYTFRPRRRPKRLRDKREKYSHSLRALAIRQKKIHLVGSPEVRVEGTPVYLDVEGLPDRDFYYLIGVRLENHNPVDQYSLWADGVEDERRIWSEFLDILARIKDPVLIHYGSYEAVFLKRMAHRYGLPTTAPTVSKAVATSVNLLSVIFAQVYFPTYSNRLKDIGHFLRVKWNGPVSSGFQSLAYRLEWERSPRPDLKAALVTYNREDCAAIEAVTSQLSQIISEAKSRTDVEFSDKPKKVASDKGGEIHAVLESLLRSAHLSYARSRIKLRQPLPAGKQELKRNPPRRSFPAIKGRIVRVPRRRICPVHPGRKLIASSRTSQHSLLDLIFSKTGCRKTIIRYTGLMGRCNLCKVEYAPPSNRLLRGQRFGWGFQAWVVYQRIALRMSYRLISKAAFDLFSEQLFVPTAIRFVVKFAESYRRTEDLLLRGVLDGPVVHLDETKINILGGDQYVWVLTDNARVVFRLRPTRETDFLKPIFSTFKGTIVTDFYGGYDALPCRQQKCLVHLIRDLNDDLWKNPFDDEFEGFVAAVRDLLVPILEDVRRFGLKSCHLGKHRSRVDRFYREKIVGQASVHDTIMRYRKRFERYKESLFAFIENDGIPWHNNAAERALRHLAVQRKTSGAFSEQGAIDYLRLLAIAQTCRFQRKSFLGFLRSKLISVDEYKERGKTRPDWLTDSWEKE